VKVLVTGATGTAGQTILHHLLAAGVAPLFGTYRSDPSPAFLETFSSALAEGRLQLLHQDLAELAENDGPEVDAVVHCAARRPASRCAADPMAAARDNITAVRRLVAWAPRHQVSLFIHCSIHSLYSGANSPYRESDPVRARDLQAEAKLESETLVTQGLPPGIRHIVLRLPHFHGANLPCDGVIAAFAAAASRGELQIAGNGEQAVCFIDLCDLASLVAALLVNPPPAGIYNAASETIRVKDLAASFQSAWEEHGRPSPSIRIKGGSQPPSYGLDCSKLFGVTTWRPRGRVIERIHGLAASQDRCS
jgi:nucleoside-diphosphate-sugar epimerase